MRRLLLALATVGVLVVGSAAPALAYDPFGGLSGACSGSAANTAVCKDKDQKDDPVSGAHGIILKVTNIIAILAGIAAVILIVVGGFRYVASAGDSKAVGEAKDTIIYALVGLAVIAIARTLIAFVMSKT